MSRSARTPTSRATRANVSGKLLYKKSPFSWWIRERVTRRGTDHLCVESPADLDGDGPRVTRNGQTRNGRRGAHGDLADASIIGFSSADRLAEIIAEIGELDASARRPPAPRTRARTQQAQQLHRLEGAHKWVQATEWADIDVDTARRHLRAKQDELADPGGQRCPRRPRREPPASRRTVWSEAESVRAKEELDAVRGVRAAVERQDETTINLDRIEADGAVTLLDDQADISHGVFGCRQPG